MRVVAMAGSVLRRPSGSTRVATSDRAHQIAIDRRKTSPGRQVSAWPPGTGTQCPRDIYEKDRDNHTSQASPLLPYVTHGIVHATADRRATKPRMSLTLLEICAPVEMGRGRGGRVLRAPERRLRPGGDGDANDEKERGHGDPWRPAIATVAVGRLAGTGLGFPGHDGAPPARDWWRDVPRPSCAWHPWFPINKSLWTSSSCCAEALSSMASLYCQGIVRQYVTSISAHDSEVRSLMKLRAEPFVALGRNTMCLFVLSGLIARLMGLVMVDTAAGISLTAESARCAPSSTRYWRWLPHGGQFCGYTACHARGSRPLLPRWGRCDAVTTLGVQALQQD